MTLLKANITANFAGNFWQTLLGLAFIPLYIRFLGIESYGLIGLFLTIQAVLGLMDLGLGGTLKRELARLSAIPRSGSDMRSTVRTLEALFWVLAAAMGAAVMLGSPWIAGDWIQAGRLPRSAIAEAVAIMGPLVSLQMLMTFYAGGLMGLQRQVLLNAVLAAAATVRGVGAVLVLWLVSPSIGAFFLWQAAVNAVTLLVLAVLLRRSLPRGEGRAEFAPGILGNVWKFAAGITGITILGAVLSQLDKVILSRMLTLEMFGYYTVATTVAMSLGRVFTPLFESVYPRFTQLASAANTGELTRLYHRSCQMLAVLVLPAATVICLFSREILFLWTRDAAVAENASLVVSLLVCGTALNGLMTLPYALQLSAGWTSLSLGKNIVSVILFVPAAILATRHYGAAGAAGAWLALNLLDVLVVIPIMHRRLLPAELGRWYTQDVGLPLAGGLLIALAGRLFLQDALTPLLTLAYLSAVSVTTLISATLVMPATRSWLLPKGWSG